MNSPNNKGKKRKGIKIILQKKKLTSSCFSPHLQKQFEIRMTIMSSQFCRLLSNKESIHYYGYSEVKQYPYCAKTNLIHSGKLFPYTGTVRFNEGKFH